MDFYTGDANADGSADAIDNNVYWRPNNGKPFDYSKGADFNMDGSVDALDINAGWRPNNGKGDTGTILKKIPVIWMVIIYSIIPVIIIPQAAGSKIQ